MKHLFLAIAIILAMTALSADAQTTPKKSKMHKGKMEMKLKEHTCTSACVDGKHVYAHGEKGHVCGDMCMKEHTCTSACTNGKHVYAHGEKGHVCGDMCKKKM